MAAIKRGGGTAAFFYDGKLPDPNGQDFADALHDQRFRTIEDAASEEVSVGWVTPADPTGDTFQGEDMAAGTGFWLRLRIDKKVLPKKWLSIHRDAMEKQRGKKLSGKERRELRDDLMDKLLPRVLPSVNLVDALLFTERKLVLLFATGKAVREAFGKLFFASFALPLVPADPLQLGRRASLSPAQQARLDDLQPVRWPQAKKERRPAARPTRAPTIDADANEATTA
jgi:hypothetical protein